MTSSTGGSYTPPPPPSGGPTPPPGGGAAGELIYPSSPPKDPVLVMVLNLLLFSSVGYFIIGQWQKGIAAVAAAFLLAALTFFVCGIGYFAVAIFAAIDGMYQAQELQAGRPIAQWTFFHDHR